MPASTLCAEHSLPLSNNPSRRINSHSSIRENFSTTASSSTVDPNSNETGLSAKFFVGKGGISRFSALNRSFNNVANLANDLKKNFPLGPTGATESAPPSASHETRSRPARFHPVLTNETSAPSTTLKESDEEKPMLITPTKEIVRQLSLRVKTKVSSTLSDPLKGKNPRRNGTTPCDEACGACLRCQQANASHSPLTKKASIKKRVADISSRLQLPKFLSDTHEEDVNGNGSVIKYLYLS